MGMNEMFIKNIINLSLSKCTLSTVSLFELLKVVLHKLTAKIAHLYLLKSKIFFMLISREAIIKNKKSYESDSLTASFTAISFLILLIVSSFLSQNAPSFTYSSNLGWLFFQFLIVPSLLFSIVAISLYVIFSIRNIISKNINVLLNMKKVIYSLLFKLYLKSYILYFHYKRSFIYDFIKEKGYMMKKIEWEKVTTSDDTFEVKNKLKGLIAVLNGLYAGNTEEHRYAQYSYSAIESIVSDVLCDIEQYEQNADYTFNLIHELKDKAKTENITNTFTINMGDVYGN